MSNEILMASVKELREALMLSMRRNSYEEAEFWRIELIDRLGALSVALTDNDGAD